MVLVGATIYCDNETTSSQWSTLVQKKEREFGDQDQRMESSEGEHVEI